MERKQNDRTLMYVSISVGLIIIGIIFTGIINRVKQSQPTDIRTRAGSSASLQFVGLVANTDTNTNSITVTNLQFANNSQQNLGTWTITPPASYNLASLRAGTSIKIGIDPVTFNIETHTAVAREITKK